VLPLEGSFPLVRVDEVKLLQPHLKSSLEYFTVRTSPQAGRARKVKVHKGHIYYAEVRSVGSLDSSSACWAPIDTGVGDDKGILQE